MKIFCAVVVYNCNIEESKTLERLIQSEYFHQSNLVEIHVLDNSTSDFGNEEYALAHGIKYTSMNGNKGLSKAYNAFVDQLDGQEGYIVLFDDDTEIPLDYLEIVSNAIQTHKDIYLPIVTDQVGLLSPNYMKGKRHLRWREPSQIDFSCMSAINSGMVINLSVFKSFRYNEEQFLDFLDHYFMRYAKKHELSVELLDATFFQNFSANEDNAKSSKVRFKILKHDLFAYYKDEKYGNLYYYFIIIRRGVRLFLRFKDLSYLTFWKKELM